MSVARPRSSIRSRISASGESVSLVSCARSSASLATIDARIWRSRSGVPFSMASSSERCSSLREEVRKHYVAYKTQTNFVDVVPQKGRLLLTLNMRFDELRDPRGLAADITNLGLWGNGDVQVELDNERQIPYAMELVSQAFAGKQPGGVADNPGDTPVS